MASKKSSPEMVTLSTAVPPDLEKKIRKAAEAECRTVSNWLRVMAEKVLEKQ